MNKRGYSKNHLKFLIFGIVFAVVIDRFVFDGTRPYIEDAREAAVTQVVYMPESPPSPIVEHLEPVEFTPKSNVKNTSETVPAWKKYAVPVTMNPDKPKIVIVIDDLGASQKYSQEIISMPGPLTLAFLPYVRHIDPLVAEGKKQGHEIMVHFPMEPMNPDLDMGDIYLSTEQTPEDFDAMLEKGLSAFDGYVGINNHMGSRLTQSPKAMARIMKVLKARGLLFLDSRTIAASVAAETAATADVPYAIRDVFLDDTPTLENVEQSLAKVERLAREYGSAIAIGHPKRHTLEALRAWLPTLEEKGFQLVPISAVVKTEAEKVSGPNPPHPAAGKAQASAYAKASADKTPSPTLRISPPGGGRLGGGE